MKLDPATLKDVTLDIGTITLGEAAEAERQSGMTIGELAKGRATLRLLALFVHGLRTSAVPPSWSDLSTLRLLDVSPSTSPSPQADPSASSSG